MTKPIILFLFTALAAPAFSQPCPQPIILTLAATNAICNGDPSGSATASATGGTGTITFSWQGCGGGAVTNGATVTDLYAGCYRVTATDANGCTAVDSVVVGEPLPFAFNSSQTPVSCKGYSDGSATIEVSGGTSPYQYIWDNGDTTPTADSLNAGFHFVTITDGAGCLVATLVIVLEPLLFALDSTTSTNTSCVGAANGSATVFAKGGTMPYSYEWSDAQGQITQTAVNLTADTYTVTVTDLKGCSFTASVTVGSSPTLTLSFINVVNETCAGACNGSATAQVMGGAPPYDYYWDDPSLPDGFATVNNLCPGTYLLEVRDILGCAVIDKVTISGATPIEVFIDSVPPSCAGIQDGSIFASAVGGQLPYLIQWSNNVTGNSISNLACGEYRMTLTDGVGCVFSDTIQLPCPEAIVVDSIVSQSVNCFGNNNGQVRVYARGGTGALGYQWNDPSQQVGPVAVNLSPGNYTVVVTDGNGCVVTASAQVTQPAPLSATINKTDVACFGGSDGIATANPAGGTEPYQYAWNWGPTTQTISSLPIGNYIVTVVDANGCTTTANTSVTQPATPLEIIASQTRTACFGENNGEAVAAALGGNGAPFSYLWSNGLTGAFVIGLHPGLINVTATDNRGCTAIASVAIQQFSKIEVGIAFVQPTCHGRSDGQAAVNLVVGGAGMGDTAKYNYQWNIPGTPNALFVDGLLGGQNYSVTATDSAGCSGSTSFFMPQPPPIVTQIAQKNITCFGLSDGLAQVMGVEGATQPVAYTWSNNTTGPIIQNLLPGTYFLTILDAKGCTDVDTVIITQPDLLRVDFAVQTLVCPDDSNAVIAANVAGGTPEYILTWNNGANTSQIGNLGPGLYVLDVVDKNGCTVVDSVIIERPGALEIRTEKTEPKCFGGKDGRLRVVLTGGQGPFRYSLNDGPFGGSSIFLGLAAGDYIVRVQDGNGCISSLAEVLGQPMQIEVSAGTDTTVTLGDSLVLSADVFNAVGFVDYEWRSFLVESFVCVDSPDCSMILVRPYQPNTYVVKVTDENGCKGEAQVTVSVEKPRGVYVPTGFTPNGDFNNDLLVVYGKSLQIRSVLTFNVYNRWGELVYQDKDFAVNDDTRGWDGSFRGKPCDPGIYVWYVEVEYQDGYMESKKGDVVLIR